MNGYLHSLLAENLEFHSITLQVMAEMANYLKITFMLVQRYFSGESKLPRDAAAFIGFICQCTRSGTPLQLNEFKRELLD